jgi:hypothetical protein
VEDSSQKIGEGITLTGSPCEISQVFGLSPLSGRCG